MKRLLSTFLVLLFYGCQEHISPVSDTTNTDTLPFGQVQGLLPLDKTEKLLRIDSLLTTDDHNGDSVYCVTNKGRRVIGLNGHFKQMLVIGGYAQNGKGSCVIQTSSGRGTSHYCFDSACTIVIDTERIYKRPAPYRLQMNGPYNPCEPCKDENNFNGKWRKMKH